MPVGITLGRHEKRENRKEYEGRAIREAQISRAWYAPAQLRIVLDIIDTGQRTGISTWT